MGGLRLPRIARLASWLVGTISVVVPMAQNVLDRGIGFAAPVVGAPIARAVVSDEALVLGQVARWLEPANQGAAKLSDSIRKDPLSFELFASFHGEAEKKDVLADVPFGGDIAKAADKHHVDSLLVAAVVEVESTFDPEAGSHKGAVGLMQLLPSTAGMPRNKLLDPDTNLDAGSAYLAELIERFDGDLALALAAYNAGPRHVRNYEGIPPFPETQQYVEKVLGIYVDYHRTLWQESGPALELS